MRCFRWSHFGKLVLRFAGFGGYFCRSAGSELNSATSTSHWAHTSEEDPPHNDSLLKIGFKRSRTEKNLRWQTWSPRRVSGASSISPHIWGCCSCSWRADVYKNTSVRVLYRAQSSREQLLNSSLMGSAVSSRVGSSDEKRDSHCDLLTFPTVVIWTASVHSCHDC